MKHNLKICLALATTVIVANAQSPSGSVPRTGQSAATPTQPNVQHQQNIQPQQNLQPTNSAAARPDIRPGLPQNGPQRPGLPQNETPPNQKQNFTTITNAPGSNLFTNSASNRNRNGDKTATGP